VRILITGVNGMLGNKIASSLVKDPSNRIFGIARKRMNEIPDVGYIYMDLTQMEDLKKNLEHIAPDVIVHCAANVNIADCENNKVKTLALHVEASEAFASFDPDARFIYMSTDSVYNGIRGNYKETDATGPVNYYAETKLSGEQAVLLNNRNTIVLRTNIYGFSKPLRSSLAEWAIAKLQNNEKIKGFDDVFFNPLYTGQLADLIPVMMNSEHTGIVNLGTTEKLSKYQFLLKIAKQFGFSEELIIKSSVADFEGLKNRPRNTTLNTSYLNVKFNSRVSIDEGIASMYEDHKRTFNE